MEATSIEQRVTAAESALAEGRGLGGTGFWSAVREMKAAPELAERYAERAAVIDRKAFENWASLTIPIGVGTAMAIAATLAGLLAVAWSYSLDGLAALLVFTVGFGAILTTTHGLGHLVVGRIRGMRFTHWFVGQLARPQPGVKVDYATYLIASAQSRAWMHASGALVTKFVPFLLVGAAFYAGLPGWYVWGLVALGVGMIVTDVLWSTKSSDWKKFKREMAFAQLS